jgi:RNA-binding protein with serine-rich domain 1
MPKSSDSSSSNSRSSSSSKSSEHKPQVSIVVLEKLSRNVTVPHLNEIFSHFGKVNKIEIKNQPNSNKLIAYM